MRLFVLALTLFWAYPLMSAAPARPPAKVIAAPVLEQEWSEYLKVLGELEARESITLTANVSDTVSRVYFDDNQRVAQGYLLLEQTSSEEQALLAEAEAELEEAQAQYERVASLSAQGTVSDADRDEAARTRRTAEARLVALNSRLADRLLKAPFSGVLGLRQVSPGQWLAPGDVVTTLDDDRVMKLSFTVPSIYLPYLRSGLTVDARSVAYPGHIFQGSIQAIDSRINRLTRSVEVIAHLDNANRMLRSGLLMNVVLHLEPRNVLVVPETAVYPKAGRQWVWLLDETSGESKARQQPVTIGQRQDGYVELLTGVNLGDRVVSHGVTKVRDGAQVNVAGEQIPGSNWQELLQPKQVAEP